MKQDGEVTLQYAGKSLLELATDKVDELTEAALAPGASDKVKGKANGAIEILALFVNPYDPNPKAVRQEAIRRVRFRQEESE